MGIKMVGFSLSLCIRDILNGKHDKRDVVKIVSGTKCASLDEFEECLRVYEVFYWDKDGRGSVIARQFWAMARLISLDCADWRHTISPVATGWVQGISGGHNVRTDNG